jgi:hypothetical protein
MRSSRSRLGGSTGAEVAGITFFVNIIEGESTIGLFRIVIGTVLSSFAGESELGTGSLSTIESQLTDVTVSRKDILILGRKSVRKRSGSSTKTVSCHWGSGSRLS